LFVAGEADDKIFAIFNASTTTDQGTGKTVFADTSHLHGPMGLTFAPNDNLVVANNDSINADPNQPSELVEFNTLGGFVRQFSIDPNIDGPFGIAAAEINEANDLLFSTTTTTHCRSGDLPGGVCQLVEKASASEICGGLSS